jgi:hypothetical protein
MTHPVLALRAAIRAAALAEPGLAALAPEGIADAAPRGRPRPYAVFESVEVRDWSTGSDTGHEQLLVIAVHAREGNDAQAFTLADALARRLDGADLALDGHRLVNLTVTASESRRAREPGHLRVALRLRAVTEVL